MKLAKLVGQLVADAKTDKSHPAATTHSGPVIPYLKFSDFQRSIVSSCTEATAVILFAASPSDVVPHCVAHTSLLGLSAQLLNDEVGSLNQPLSPSSTAKTVYQRRQSTSQQFSPSGTNNNNNSTLSYLVSKGAPTDPSAERSILDISNLKKLSSSDSVLMVLANAARQGSWVLLPEVSALSLSIWTDIGKLLHGVKIMLQVKEDEDEAQQKMYRNKNSVAKRSTLIKNYDKHDDDDNGNHEDENGDDVDDFEFQHQQKKLTPTELSAVAFAKEYGLDETNFSSHFRFVVFLTEKSAALGRTLPPKITSSIKVVDTRGAVRTVQELTALFSSVTPLSEKQFSLLCVGIGDGRPSDHHQRSNQQVERMSNASTSSSVFSGSYSNCDLAADLSLVNTSLGQLNTSSSPPATGASLLRQDQYGGASSNSLLALRHQARGRNNNNNHNNQASASSASPASFLVNWPCAAALADAKNITVFSSNESATTTEYVDSALFALRETLLRSLRDMISQAQLLDNRFKMTRKKALEARALRTGQDLGELEQIEAMRQTHAETHLSRLEKTPGWLYPEIYRWCVSCAPMVELEKLTMISHEDLTFDDIIWVHEGVGDATACLKGTWELSPVCLKCALPSVRGEVTRELNDKLIVEGRTLFSLRHPSILGVYGVCELPTDLSLVQGGNMVLRPLLSAASMHERWLDAQEDAIRNNNNISGSGPNQKQQGASEHPSGGSVTSSNAGTSAVLGPTSSVIVKQYALVTESFEMSLEQILVDSFDKSRKWTVEQFLDVGVAILRALVHISEKLVHRCVCPSNVVVCAQNFSSTTITSSSSTKKAGDANDGEENDDNEDNNPDTRGDDQDMTSSPKRGIESSLLFSDVQHAQSREPSNLVPSSKKKSSSPSSSTRNIKYQYKLSQFSACLPTNKRVAPSWLVETSTAKIPLRYCAPETFWGQFTPASDIWSFGVTMWSVVHYCRKQPYEGGNNKKGHHQTMRHFSSGSGGLAISNEESSMSSSTPRKRQNNINNTRQIYAAAPILDESELGTSDQLLVSPMLNASQDTIRQGRPHHHPPHHHQQEDLFGENFESNEISTGSLPSSAMRHPHKAGMQQNTRSHTQQTKKQIDGPAGETPQTIAEGVSRGTFALTPLPAHFPSFFWDEIIEPCIRRRPQERPDARALITSILLLKVQHKGMMHQFVEFDRPGF